MRLRHRRAHRLAWCALLVLLPLTLAAALWQRAAAPAREAPMRIAPP